MKFGNLVFDESSKEEVLKMFGKAVDDEGYIVEEENTNQRVLTARGEEIHFDEWAGVVQGSEAFVKSDAFSLIELAKRIN
ncbi:hypothetical protein HN827_08730 [archaeon]|jgi:hypothetical protein|nr:hypothetical protein [archaeon]MBT4021809.1 hypothetical protein [archaeon]MBT4271776.1 hypothetical protein [archaeon]MBT4461420.1 hypothetical protein [archaeon]MBT6772836.1 hypothetical protein [archaeon]